MSPGPQVDNDSLQAIIQESFGDQIRSIEESFGMLDIIIHKNTIVPFITYLKNHELLQFRFLTSLCGVHFPEKKEGEFSVVYHLHSFVNNLRIRVHIFMAKVDLEVPTLTGIFPGANWMERETFEFYGIQFTGHPDLRVILNMEDIGYHPLRKEYPLVDDTRTDKEDKYFGR
jgi:NADH-quinone oxidoreductase subunit C